MPKGNATAGAGKVYAAAEQAILINGQMNDGRLQAEGGDIVDVAQEIHQHELGLDRAYGRGRGLGVPHHDIGKGQARAGQQ